MSTSTARRVIIIGGGASGALLAYQLLRDPSSAFRVTLIEKRSDIGRGVAYSTVRNEHLLNVHAANMSALPDDPIISGAGCRHVKSTARSLPTAIASYPGASMASTSQV
jgi:cation diffusion facilitator CzcD-associated flavoprotein CzcO